MTSLWDNAVIPEHLSAVHALVQSGRLDEVSAAPRLGEAEAIRFSLGCP
jgi:hypothetical protein